MSKNSDVTDCPCCNTCEVCGKRITRLVITVSGYADRSCSSGCDEINGVYYAPVWYDENCTPFVDPLPLNGGGVYGYYDPPWIWTANIQGVYWHADGPMNGVIIRCYINGNFWSGDGYALPGGTTCAEFLAGVDYHVYLGGGFTLCDIASPVIHVQPEWA